MYTFYEELWFIDECYIWNNAKNGSVYSWYDKNKEALIDYEDEEQIKVGLCVAISNKGRCYYSIIR